MGNNSSNRKLMFWEAKNVHAMQEEEICFCVVHNGRVAVHMYVYVGMQGSGGNSRCAGMLLLLGMNVNCPR